VLATGVALVVVGPGHDFLVGLHKASFIVWLAAAGSHVLAYIRRVPRLAAADWRRGRVSGSLARRTLLAGVLVAGAILAVMTKPYAKRIGLTVDPQLSRLQWSP
jgi:hypothetical protein